MQGACPRSLVLLPLSLAIEGGPQPSQDSEKDAHPPLPQLEVFFFFFVAFTSLLGTERSRLDEVELSFPFKLMA